MADLLVESLCPLRQRKIIKIMRWKQNQRKIIKIMRWKQNQRIIFYLQMMYFKTQLEVFCNYFYLQRVQEN